MSFRFKPPDSPTKKDELDDPFDDGGQEDQEDQGPSTPQVIQTDVNQHLVIRQLLQQEIKDNCGSHSSHHSPLLPQNSTPPPRSSRPAIPSVPSRTRTQLPIRFRIEILFIKRVLGDGPTLDNFTAYIYDCERNTLPGISHEVLRVPEEYWDRKRISTNLRSNLTNPEIDAPGLIKFDQVAAELIWVNEITPQENDPTLAQSMDGYISELFSRRLRRPQGCFFQNFSMYSMLGKFEQADVWFCDVIAWTKVVDSGGDTRHAAHIIIMNIAGTQSYSDIVQARDVPSHEQTTQIDGDNSLSTFFGILLFVNNLGGNKKLICMSERHLRSLVPEKLSSFENVNLMGVPDRYESDLPQREFANNIKILYSPALASSPLYTIQYGRLHQLLREHSELNNTEKWFLTFKSNLGF